jgi:lactoylglutathione lyase
MELGAFSVSLTVADLDRSIAFYRKLGFESVPCGPGYAILKSGPTVIGLFQGMFERNMLTFNPGWGQDAQPVAGDFTDVRELRKRIADAGIEITSSSAATEKETGPAHFTVVDPDGNPILIDQHR